LCTLVVVVCASLILARDASATVTVNAHSNGVCSPNAVGDGTTNDRGAIQCAIDHVSANGGGTVVLPGTRTYKSGGLVLKSDVTLQIDAGATLEQSQTVSDYASPQPGVGHSVPCSSNCPPWNYYFYKNQPFIYAGGKTSSSTTDVAVVGEGTIEMTRNAPFNGETTIEMFAIGFSHVDGFEVSGIDVVNGNAVYLGIYNSDNGTVSDVTFNNLGAHWRNTGGIELMNSQHVRITGSTMDLNDDGIAVYQSYGDPRGTASAWWSSNTNTQPTTDVRIDGNDISAGCCKAIAIIPWGSSDPVAANATMSDVVITNNVLTSDTNYAVGCWCDDPWSGQSPFSGTEVDPSPMREWTFENNTYSSRPANIGSASIVNISCDWSGCPSRSGVMVDDTSAQFSYSGTWTTYTDSRDHGGSHRTTNSSGGSVTISFNGTQAKVIGQRGHNTGIARVYVDGLDAGYVDLYEPTYQYQDLIFDTGVLPAGNHTVQLVWTGTRNASSSGTYIDVDGVSVDATSDDSSAAFAFSGAWTSYANAADHGGSHRTANSSGSAATISFSGTRAKVIGVKGHNLGIAQVKVDGTVVGTVDFYSPSYSYKTVVFDTGVLPAGNHTVQLVWTGTRNASSTGTYIDVDGVTVTA
jgi:hypothetical protein